MDLKKINEEYETSKLKLEKLDKTKQKVEELKKEITSLIRHIQDLNIAKRRAEEDNDKQAVQQIDEDLKAALAKFKSARMSLYQLQSVIENSENAVDSRLAELSRSPEIQKHLNTVIGKKFSRQISHKQKEKETLLSYNEQLEAIKTAAQKDPYVMNTIKGIEGYLKKIEELESKTLADTGILYMTYQDHADVYAATARIEMRRKDLATYFKGTISDEVIKSFTSYDDISRRIKLNTMQTKGIDKQIANYTIALERIGYVPSKTDSESVSKREGQEGSNWHDERNTSNLPDTQPKWYQFVKRFKNWVNTKRVAKSSDNLGDKESDGKSPTEDISLFKNSLKYDVVKDYEAKLEKDLLKDAKLERKATSQKNTENDLSL